MKNILYARQKKVKSYIPTNVSAIIFTNLSNIRYLTNFSGSSAVLLLPKYGRATFITDFRYQEQATQEIYNSARIVVTKSTILDTVSEIVNTKNFEVIAVEGSIRLDQYQYLKKKTKTKIVIIPPITEKVRQIKDRFEIEVLKKAFQITDKSFKKLLEYIKPGMTERNLAARLEMIVREEGAECTSFPTIIAAGSHSSCPHAQPTDRKIKQNEMLKIDFGVTYKGYRSDMTRTIYIGKADEKFKNIYNIVLEAQKLAIDKITANTACSEVDAAARDYIKEKGYGDNFGHGLGHGIGLDIHESPSYSPRSTDYLKAGMVLTVEPGIYIPGWGGIRIEDVYLVTKKSPIKLTITPNNLLELSIK